MHAINPAPDVLRIETLAIDRQHVVIYLRSAAQNAICPSCARASARIHSRYWRHAADVPLSGNAVRIRVQSRRFFCDEAECDQQIFCERFPGVLEPYARLTDRAKQVLLELTHASNAEQAARVGRLIGLERSGASLITLQRRESFQCESPDAIGIDEFAWRRGSKYGTLIVDLQRHMPIDLLPTDRVEEVSHWFERHPPVSVVSRDRDEVFAKAARETVPDALQVADRFHLVKNVLDAFRQFLLSRRWKTAAREDGGKDDECSSPDVDHAEDRRTSTPRKRMAWEQVHTFAKQGLTISAIARSSGMNRRTVRKYLKATEPPVFRVSVGRPSKADPYVDYLLQRWKEGERNSAKLYEEICERGYEGAPGTLRHIVARWRTGEPGQKKQPDPPPPVKLAIRWRRKLEEGQAAELDAFLSLNPELDAAYRLKESFREAMAAKNVAQLDRWIAWAASSGIACFQSLAKGMRRDYGAVSASFTSAWSNGQCEGQITRVKLIKRMGYGRAKPDLLRARVLHRMVAA